MSRADCSDDRCARTGAGVNYREEVVQFEHAGDALIGILGRPDELRSSTGVLVIVGGPQYRVGSHRQFVLLTRRLARSGYCVLRFDYRGMGDSAGEMRPFDAVDGDIGAAIDALMRACPDLRSVCLWGLCDAASAAMMYAPADGRVAGLALLNPWIRSEATIARTYLRHYYTERLVSREFWKKLFSQSFSPIASARSLAGNFFRALRRSDGKPSGERTPFQARMLRGLERFRGPVLLMLSGRDLTAQEFVSVTEADARWRRTLQPDRLKRWELPQADHTFSSQEWRAAVENETLDWLGRINQAGR